MRRTDLFARAKSAFLFFFTLPAAGVSGALSCSSQDANSPPAYQPRDALLDSTTCGTCHADHFRDWSGSMHAYASDDPVFVAMNARGQRETNGMLGNFCVKCHAPMAVREGATTDGLNLATVPQKLKGVTCFFCHDTAAVTGTNDDGLQGADDIIMRGPFTDPVANTAHPSGYSNIHDVDQIQSADFCGSCHDVVNGHGISIERTFQEWQGTVFSQPLKGQTCGQCHMKPSANLVPVAQAPGVFSRRYHAHDFPALDVALTDFPQADTERQNVQDSLNNTLATELCVGQGTGGIHVAIENVGAGHDWPSGAAQDRRAWVEVIAYSAGKVIYQSGVVPDGMPVTQISDPDLWLLRECMLDAQDAPVPMFWQAASMSESYQLPGLTTFNQLDPAFYAGHIYQTYPGSTRMPSTGAAPLTVAPDRVTMRVRVQPIGLDVIDDLVTSGDLDTGVGPKIPTFDVGLTPLVEWTAATATPAYTLGGLSFSCVTKSSFNPASCQPGAPNSCTAAPPHGHCRP